MIVKSTGEEWVDTPTHPFSKTNYVNIGVQIGRVPNVPRTQDEEKTETLVTCFISRGFLGSTIKILSGA